MRLLTTNALLASTFKIPLLPMIHGEGDLPAMRAEAQRQNLTEQYGGIVMVHAEPTGDVAEQQQKYGVMIRQARKIMPRARLGCYHSWRTTISAERVTFPTANLNTPDEVMERLNALATFTPKKIYPKIDLRNWHDERIAPWGTGAIEDHFARIAKLGASFATNPFPKAVLFDDSDTWPTFVAQYGEVVDGRPLADMMRAECGSADAAVWHKHTLSRWGAVVEAIL